VAQREYQLHLRNGGHMKLAHYRRFLSGSPTPRFHPTIGGYILPE